MTTDMVITKTSLTLFKGSPEEVRAWLMKTKTNLSMKVVVSVGTRTQRISSLADYLDLYPSRK